jgi:prepilin-type processing-associated H-X9-DG protein
MLSACSVIADAATVRPRPGRPRVTQRVGGTALASSERRSGSSSAFTLVELLVVIGVVAILLVLLLPALAAVRAAARSAKCSGALSQQGRLVHAFAADRQDQAPLAARLWEHPASQFSREYLHAGLYYYYESGPGSVERPMPFFATLAASAGVEFDTSSREAMRMQLGYPGTTGPAAAAFFQLTRCPDDTSFDPNQVSHLGNTLLPNDLTWTVLGGLGEMTSYMLNEWVLGEAPRPEVRMGGRLSRVAQPARVTLIMDGEPRLFEPPVGINYMLYFNATTTPGYTLRDYNEYFCAWTPPELCPRGVYYQFGYAADPDEYTANERGRHSHSTNVLFVDGHVQTVPLKPEALERLLVSDP